MRPIIFDNADEMKSYLRSVQENFCSDDFSIDTEYGDMTSVEILDQIIDLVDDSFKYKKMLAKSSGGLGNTKSVRRLATETTDMYSEVRDEEYQQSVAEYQAELDKIMGNTDSALSNAMAKAMNFIMKNRVGKAKTDAQQKAANSAIALVEDSVDHLISSLNKVKGRVLAHAQESDDIEAIEMSSKVLSKFANLQKYFNKALILERIQ